MLIRRAHAADADAVGACARAAYARYVPRIGRAPAPMVADYGALITAGHVHVAEQDGVAGFVTFFRDRDAMLLESVAVLPDRAGRGIGTALIAYCEAAARDAGLSCVRLYTNAAMHENLLLYPRLGYAQAGRRHEDGFDRVFFEKRLAG
jgi:GNAT superfamily N-acetyltransferase